MFRRECYPEAVLEPQLRQELLILQLLVLLEAHSFENQILLRWRRQGPVVLHSLFLVLGCLQFLRFGNLLLLRLWRYGRADVRKVLVLLYRVLPIMQIAHVVLLLRTIQLVLLITVVFRILPLLLILSVPILRFLCFGVGGMCDSVLHLGSVLSVKSRLAIVVRAFFSAWCPQPLPPLPALSTLSRIQALLQFLGYHF